MDYRTLTGFLSAVALTFVVHAHYQGSYTPGTQGVDVSYPNCAQELPVESQFAVLGVTGGRNFSPNPCLQSEAWRAVGANRSVALYVNTGYPGASYAQKFTHAPLSCGADEAGCLAYNYGWQAGKYAADYARSQGVDSDVWWLDVELANSWTDDPGQNRLALEGMHEAIATQADAEAIGFYSTPTQWRLITDGWANGAPGWVATGSDLEVAARGACDGQDFTGGGTVLAQYVRELDTNYVCGD